MIDTANRLVERASASIVDQGVMGAFVILFFVTAGVLLWVLLKDKDYQKSMADTFKKMAENQKVFNNNYQTSEEHHKEMMQVIINVLKQERESTRSCYEKVERQLEKLLMQNGG